MTKWKDAKCATDYDWSYYERPFFEQYEHDTAPFQTRKFVDAMCNACPVQKKCGDFGKATKSTGVFGGTFLKNGEPVPLRSNHR